MSEELQEHSCLLDGPEYSDQALSVEAAKAEAERRAREETVSASSVPPLKWAGVRQARAVTPVRRDVRDISHIVLHTPEGYEQGTLNVLNGTRAGFDYFLPLSGNLYNTNDFYEYISWQAGDGIQRIQSYGYHSIGIEQGDFAARARQFGEAHYRRLAHLCAWLQAEHLPSVRVRHETQRGQSGGGYIYHRTITPGQRTDPGDFPMGDFLAMVSGFLRGSEHEPTPPQTNLVYRVIAGSFSQRSNAESHASKLQRAGFGKPWIYVHEGMHRVQVASFSDEGSARESERAVEGKGFDAFVMAENLKAEPDEKPGEGRDMDALIQRCVDRLLPFNGAFYAPWEPGEDGQGPPLWANRLPTQDEIFRYGGVCTTVTNCWMHIAGVSIPDNFGGTGSLERLYHNKGYPFRRGKVYPRGTLFGSPYKSAKLSEQGHVCVSVSREPEANPWVMQSDTGKHWNTARRLYETDDFSNFTYAVPSEVWLRR